MARKHLSEPRESNNIVPPIFGIAPRERWVQDRSIEGADQNKQSSPRYFELIDYQTRLSDGRTACYVHTRMLVNDASTIEDASQFLYELEPDNQHIIFHSCHLIRNGSDIDVLDVENIRAVQREQALESFIVSNTMTIIFHIDDLRVGDIIDLEVTTIESSDIHPLFGHYHHKKYWLTWGTPVQQQHITIINDRTADVKIQHLDTDNGKDDLETLKPGVKFEQVLYLLPAVTFGEKTPVWFYPPCISVTTESSWPEISRHLYSYYTAHDVFAEDIDISDIQGIDWNTSDAVTVIRIIRFVQDEIRYRGETQGIYSHTPKRPDRTLQKRAGDCKDKSSLLVALLNKAGVSAHLALVNTNMYQAVQLFQPSPWLFNHMIVYINHEGRDYFVDATKKKQGGSLNNTAELPYGAALVLDKIGQDICPIPYSFNKLILKVQHVFDLTRSNFEHPTVCVTREYWSERANNMRYYFDSTEKTVFEDNYQQEIVDDLDCKVETIEPIHIISDDRDNNIIKSKECYQLIAPTKSSELNRIEVLTSFYQDFLISAQDGFPVALYPDGILEHVIIVEYVVAPECDLDSAEVKNKWFDYRDNTSREKNRVIFNMVMKPLAEVVNKDDLENFRKDAEKVRLRSSSGFPVTQKLLPFDGSYLYVAAAVIAALIIVMRTGIFSS